MSTLIFDRHGATISKSKNLAGLMRYYSAHPADLVIKVRECPNGFAVTFFFDDGVEAHTVWGDWRVLLDWLRARRSWSIKRVTFHTPLYDYIEGQPEGAKRFGAFRANMHTIITAHTYPED